MTFELFWIIGFILYWVILIGMMWVDNYLNHYHNQIDDHLSTVVISLFPVVNAIAALFLFVLLCCVVWDGRQIIVLRFNSFRGK